MGLGCELQVRSETQFIQTKNGYGPKRMFSVPRFRTTSGQRAVASYCGSFLGKSQQKFNNELGFSVSVF